MNSKRGFGDQAWIAAVRITAHTRTMLVKGRGKAAWAFGAQRPRLPSEAQPGIPVNARHVDAGPVMAVVAVEEILNAEG